MKVLPFTLPGAHSLLSGQTTPSSDVDTGGYDVLIGGIGFRLATDQTFPYLRATEPTTVHRFDNSAEVGEQTLSPLPWLKSQSSFHAGAGQLNLEAPYTAFQYQQEQIAHLRFDTCVGVDVWTPGQVQRLPDAKWSNFGFDAKKVVTAVVGGVDVAVVGGTHSLYSISWASGPDSAPTITAIDLTSAVFGGQSNITVQSLTTDGVNYYGVINLTSVGSLAGVQTYVISGAMGSTSAPVTRYAISGTVFGIVGWVKERLIGCVGNSVYELSPVAATNSALPTAKYTHPISVYTYSAISESPRSILIAGSAGMAATILQFALDTSGATPTLGGGATICTLPTGEQVLTIAAYLGAFVALGTNKGIRVGTFDTYTGDFVLGPLSVTTTSGVYGLTGRDRFVFGSYTNQHADGKTGLVRIDLSQPIDSAGRLAWAPDLRAPTTAPTGLGTVYGVTTLPSSGRLMFLTPEGFHVEGPGPGSDGTSWIRTSRIRYDTDELKLFKSGRIHGTLDQATISVEAIQQFGISTTIGTFGFLAGSSDPGEIAIPVGLQPWIQMQYTLNGSACILNSYIVKALPAPSRQRVITVTVNCFRQETDRYGLSITDPLLPRDRYAAVKQLESTGGEVRFVEFTNTGPVATLVVIDQIEYHSFSRPNIDDDFGGYITFKLRETVST